MAELCLAMGISRPVWTCRSVSSLNQLNIDADACETVKLFSKFNLILTLSKELQCRTFFFSRN